MKVMKYKEKEKIIPVIELSMVYFSVESNRNDDSGETKII